jgi:hypothetical protein
VANGDFTAEQDRGPANLLDLVGFNLQLRPTPAAMISKRDKSERIPRITDATIGPFSR